MYKKTKEEIVKKLKEINPNIEIVGDYIDTKTKVLCRCLIDNCKHEWMVKPNSLLQGNKCPECAKRIKRLKTAKTTTQYKQELKDKNIQIECLGEYINSHTKILHKCLIHNYKWEITPDHILAGCGCKLCRKEKQSKSISKGVNTYISQLQKYNPTITLIGNYIDRESKVEHKCEVCGYTWSVRPAQLITPRGRKRISGCPQCNHSKLANRIKYYLDIRKFNYKQEYTFKDCKYKGHLRFDFAILNGESLLCLIEADGIQHYQPVQFGGCTLEQAQYNLKEQQAKDSIKNKYCQDNNIKLLRIPYWDFDNIEEILKKELFKGGGRYA